MNEKDVPFFGTGFFVYCHMDFVQQWHKTITGGAVWASIVLKGRVIW